MNKEKLKYEFKKHLSDSTAIVTISNPIYAGLETMVVGMSDEISIKSRIINTGLMYAGLGSLTKLRDFSKKLFKIGKDSKEYIKGLHDILFAGTFIIGIKPLVYLASGETDLKKIGLATAMGVLIGGTSAYPIGYLVDAYRDLLGIEKSGRLPKAIEKKDPKFKKTLATILTVGSIGAVGLVYTLNGK